MNFPDFMQFKILVAKKKKVLVEMLTNNTKKRLRSKVGRNLADPITSLTPNIYSMKQKPQGVRDSHLPRI